MARASRSRVRQTPTRRLDIQRSAVHRAAIAARPWCKRRQRDHPRRERDAVCHAIGRPELSQPPPGRPLPLGLRNPIQTYQRPHHTTRPKRLRHERRRLRAMAVRQPLATPILPTGDDPNFAWDDMSKQTGICYQRSQVKMADIKDGSRATRSSSARNISTATTTPTARTWATTRPCTAATTWTCSVGRESTARWAPAPTTTCRGKTTRHLAPAMNVQWFGSAHANVFNMSFCDGSVRGDQLLDRRRGLPPPWEPQRRPARRRQPVLIVLFDSRTKQHDDARCDSKMEPQRTS